MTKEVEAKITKDRSIKGIQIDLSKNYKIKVGTHLELMDAIIYRSRTGTTSKHSTFVSVMVIRRK